MTTQLKMSSKGQVVLPKSMRDRFGWEDGTRIEVIEQADRVTLLAKPQSGTLTIDEVLAQLAEINPYRGPRVSDSEMEEAVGRAVAEEYEQSCRR